MSEKRNELDFSAFWNQALLSEWIKVEKHKPKSLKSFKTFRPRRGNFSLITIRSSCEQVQKFILPNLRNKEFSPYFACCLRSNEIESKEDKFLFNPKPSLENFKSRYRFILHDWLFGFLLSSLFFRAFSSYLLIKEGKSVSSLENGFSTWIDKKERKYFLSGC